MAAAAESNLVTIEITNWGYEGNVPGSRLDVEPHVARGLINSGHAKPANKSAEKSLEQS